MYLDWLASAMIRLEQFFQYFDNSPHQRAAIQRLQEDMPPELLEHDSEWFEIWKSGGKLVPFKVPYFSQYELKNGYRKCFTTAMAMIAAHYGVIAEHENYDRVRIKYGDTVEVSRQTMLGRACRTTGRQFCCQSFRPSRGKDQGSNA